MKTCDVCKEKDPFVSEQPNPDGPMTIQLCPCCLVEREQKSEEKKVA